MDSIRASRDAHLEVGLFPAERHRLGVPGLRGCEDTQTNGDRREQSPNPTERRTTTLEKTLFIKFDQDSKRYHRFKVVDPEGDVTGTVYFPKTMNPLPEKLVLETKRD